MSTSATSLTFYTPAQTTPNTRLSLTGVYTGSPQSLDYNFGSGWIQATSVSFSSGRFIITIPAGVAAGSYVPEIRDHYATSVTSTAGSFVVSAWTPETLKTSPGASAVFEFNPNTSASTVAITGTVSKLVNSVNSAQYLGARTGSSHNPIVVAVQSGADGKRRLLQFHASKLSASTADPSTNWLSAGGTSGTAGSALVNLANSTNLSKTGSFSTVIAMDIDKSYTYAAGPIWGSLAKPGPLQYAQLRYNNGSGYAGAQVIDSAQSGPSAQSTITAGWHVLTMIKSAGTLTYRLDGKQIATAAVTSTKAFTASDFMIGGGFPPASSASAAAENGVPAPYVGEYQAYTGVLAGSDLTNAESLAANSIGLKLASSTSSAVAATSASHTVPASQTADLSTKPAFISGINANTAIKAVEALASSSRTSGNLISHSDSSDLKAAMSSAAWNTASDLSRYLTHEVSNSAHGLQLHHQGGSASTVLASLAASYDKTIFAGFAKHLIIS